MDHWKRHILAAASCLLGGGAVLVALALLYVLVIRPDFERPSDLPFPIWVRSVFAFAFVFCTVHFSAYLLPRKSRRDSTMISGGIVIVVFLAALLLSARPFRASAYLLVPMILDASIIVGAVALAWLLHPRKWV